MIDEIKKRSPAPYSWEQFILYFIESVVTLDLDHKPQVPQFVLDYLMRVEDWGEMELSLFGFTLDVETTHFSMRKALKRSKQYIAIPSNAKLLYIILSNNFSAFFSL